mgnify:CR=1 FL=1
MKWCDISFLIVLAVVTGCGKPNPADRYVRPDQISNFETLFGQNCAGCHGASGQFGPAPPLNDPLFQAIISDEQLTHLAVAGREGTMMPAFDKAQGGTLTDKQIGILVQGIRARWAGPPPRLAEKLPAYQVDVDDPAGIRQGSVATGADLFATVCARCHGDEGHGGDAGSISGRVFGQLISDQLLRRIIITGRADLEMPNFIDSGMESELGRPLTAPEIIDIATYLRAIQQENDENE